MSSVGQQELYRVAVDVDHNPYLAEGAGTLDAIVSIAVGSEVAVDKPLDRLEAIIIDCSTSMLSPPRRSGPPRPLSRKLSTGPPSRSSPAPRRRSLSIRLTGGRYWRPTRQGPRRRVPSTH